MAIADIHKWIQGAQRYNAGVLLFVEHNPDPGNGLETLLKSGKTSFTQNKLYSALRQIVDAETPRPVAKSPAPTKRNIAQEDAPDDNQVKLEPIGPKQRHQLGHTDGYPQHLVELDAETHLNLKRLDKMKLESVEIPEGPELFEHAKQRVFLDRYVIRKAFERLDHFAQTRSELPGTEPATEMQHIALLFRAQKRNPPYISKNKNSTDPQVQAKVELYRKQLAEIDDFCKTHTT